MIVLGMDTATAATAVALRLGDGETIEARDDPTVGQHPGHATRLLGLADGLLAQAGVRWGGVERIAVGLGPGTFTGLRIGVATARALSQSLEVELVGVSTLRVLGEPALRSPLAGASTKVLAVIDARRGEVFVGAYGEQPGLPRARELAAAQTLAPQQLAGFVRALEPGAAQRWLAVGDGALRFREHLAAAGATLPDELSALHRVSASVLCEVGCTRSALASEQLLPDYLRRPDAEIALEARNELQAGAL